MEEKNSRSVPTAAGRCQFICIVHSTVQYELTGADRINGSQTLEVTPPPPPLNKKKKKAEIPCSNRDKQTQHPLFLATVSTWCSIGRHGRMCVAAR